MCRIFVNEDECLCYPDCDSCYDLDSWDYLYPEEWSIERRVQAINNGMLVGYILYSTLCSLIQDCVVLKDVLSEEAFKYVSNLYEDVI